MSRGVAQLVGALKRVNATVVPENSVALRTAVLVGVMAAGISVISAGIGGPLLRLAVVAGIPAGFVVSHLTRQRPRYLRKLAVALVATAAFVQFMSSAVGLPANELTRLRVPLAELFLWVQAVHSFDLPARRDLMVTLLSSLALVMVGGALSTSLGFGIYLMVWAVAAVTALVLAHRSRLGEIPALGARPAGGDGAAGTDGTRRRSGAGLRTVVPVLLGVVLVALGAFLVVPATGSGRVIPLPAGDPAAVPNPGGIWNPSLGDRSGSAADGSGLGAAGRTRFGYFGFSTSLDTAARGRPDDTPVMRVRAARPDFWRGQTFDSWDGRRWTISDERPTILTGAGILEVPPGREDRFAQLLGAPLVQTYFVQRPGPNLFFSAYKADQLYLPVESAFALSDGTLRSPVELGKGTVYSVVSRAPKVTPEVLRSSRPVSESRVQLPPNFMERYTQLPDVPARVRELAAGVTAGAPTVYDKVLALEQWMADNTVYSLRVPPLPEGADAVDQYLFVDRRGFCEQIGSSLVVMLRSLGIPARLVVGYLPGERDPFSGLWQVRARDAHSWAEVYFPGVGWQGFDPTASVPLSGEAELPSPATALASFVKARLPSVAFSGPGLVVLAALGLLALANTIARLLPEGNRWRRGIRRRRRAGPPRWVEGYVDRLERAARRRGAPRLPTETVREYVDRLERSCVFPAVPLREIVPVLETEQFSGTTAGDRQRRRAEELLDSALSR